jgi:hypothetical protein
MSVSQSNRNPVGNKLLATLAACECYQVLKQECDRLRLATLL